MTNDTTTPEIISRPKSNPVRGYAEWGENQHIDLGVARLEHAVHDVMVELVDRYTQPNGSLLEIGCGRGEFLSDISKRRADIGLSVGDAFRSCLDRAGDITTLEHAYLLSTDRFDLLDVADGQRFDTVIASHVVEHLLDPVEAVRAMVASTKPGGHVIIAVPNVGSPVLVFNGARKNHCANPGHAFGWDRSHWMNFLETILGLDVVEYASDSVTIFPRSLSQRFAPLRNLEAAAANGPLAWWADSHIAVIRA